MLVLNPHKQTEKGKQNEFRKRNQPIDKSNQRVER